MELFDEIKAHISHRMSNPFTPAFLVSWCVWNYKTLILLFSGMNPLTKIIKIQDIYAWETWYHNGVVQGLLLPALFAGVYVAASPWVSRLILVYWKGQENSTKLQLVKIEDEHPLTREEIRQIRVQMQETEEALNRDLARAEARIARLNTEVNDFDDERAKHHDELTQAQAATSEAKSEFARLRAELAEKQDEIKALQEELRVVEDILDEINAENKRRLSSNHRSILDIVDGLNLDEKTKTLLLDAFASPPPSSKRR